MKHFGRIGLLPLSMVALTLGACSGDGRSDEQLSAGVSEDLLSTGKSFSDDVTVKPDRLEVPLAGHEEVLRYERGKLLVGGPNEADLESETNPHGFLRRVKSVRREGATIVVDTTDADLTDLFTGDVLIESENELLPVRRENAGDRVTPQANWSGSWTQRIDFPSDKPLFDKRFEVGSTTYTLGVKLDHGYFEFTPSVATSIEIKRGALQQLKVVASGELKSEVAIDVDVTASDAGADASGAPHSFEIELYKFPRQRWMQMIGFVPVWEALEVRVVLGCDVKVRGALHGQVAFQAGARLSAGGEYVKGRGLAPILEGPTFAMQPRWELEAAGNVQAKCALTPQVGLYVYDLIGPTLTLGPYLDGSVALAAAGGGSWSLQPGFTAEFGGRAAVFGRTFFDERITLIDRPFGRPFTGTF